MGNFVDLVTFAPYLYVWLFREVHEGSLLEVGRLRREDLP